MHSSFNTNYSNESANGNSAYCIPFSTTGGGGGSSYIEGSGTYNEYASKSSLNFTSANVMNNQPKIVHSFDPASSCLSSLSYIGIVSHLSGNIGEVDGEIPFHLNLVQGTHPKIGERVFLQGHFSRDTKHVDSVQTIKVPNFLQGMNPNQSSKYASYQFSSNQPSFSPPKLRREYTSKTSRQDQQEFRNNRKRCSRSPPATISALGKEKSRSRSPRRPSSRIVPKYFVQLPKRIIDTQMGKVGQIRSRYTNLYIPSAFLGCSFTWLKTFPLERPFSYQHPCKFYICDSGTKESIKSSTLPQNHEYPIDVDFRFIAKVMLLNTPGTEQLYQRCGVNDPLSYKSENYQHFNRLIKFLVGSKNKTDILALGGPWSPSLDGKDPMNDPQVLINTAIRNVKFLTGIDLSPCVNWYPFLEVYYYRPAETRKGIDLAERIETVVMYIPDAHTIMPSKVQWDEFSKSFRDHDLLLELEDRETLLSRSFDKSNMPNTTSTMPPSSSSSSSSSKFHSSFKKKEKTLPNRPSITVFPNLKAKKGKFDCQLLSLASLLDYRSEATKEYSFEVSLFAELFNQMMQRDFAYNIFKALVMTPYRLKDTPTSLPSSGLQDFLSVKKVKSEEKLIKILDSKRDALSYRKLTDLLKDCSDINTSNQTPNPTVDNENNHNTSFNSIQGKFLSQEIFVPKDCQLTAAFNTNFMSYLQTFVFGGCSEVTSKTNAEFYSLTQPLPPSSVITNVENALNRLAFAEKAQCATESKLETVMKENESLKAELYKYENILKKQAHIIKAYESHSDMYQSEASMSTLKVKELERVVASSLHDILQISHRLQDSIHNSFPPSYHHFSHSSILSHANLFAPKCTSSHSSIVDANPQLEMNSGGFKESLHNSNACSRPCENNLSLSLAKESCGEVTHLSNACCHSFSDKSPPSSSST